MSRFAFLVLAFSFIASVGISNDIIEYTNETALRVEECGCEEGTLYLYTVLNNGSTKKKELGSYGSEEACKEAIPHQSECKYSY